MIYLFYGNDFEKTRARVNSFLEQLHAKKPDASLFEYGAENFKKEDLEGLIRGEGLFQQRYIIVLRGLLTLPEVSEYIVEHMQEFANSMHVFVFVEQKLDAKLVKKISAYAQKIWKTDNKESISKKSFNPFALGDAFSARDRKKTWIIFSHAIDMEKMAPEAVHGIFFAQIKNMLLVKKENKNPGLKLFVFQKIERSAKNYSIEELEKISSELVDIYHNARRGICEMRTALERLVLNI